MDQLISDCLITVFFWGGSQFHLVIHILIRAAKAKLQHEQNWMSQQLGAFMGHVEVPSQKSN